VSPKTILVPLQLDEQEGAGLALQTALAELRREDLEHRGLKHNRQQQQQQKEQKQKALGPEQWEPGQVELAPHR
jgi:hypothetical protein